MEAGPSGGPRLRLPRHHQTALYFQADLHDQSHALIGCTKKWFLARKLWFTFFLSNGRDWPTFRSWPTHEPLYPTGEALVLLHLAWAKKIRNCFSNFGFLLPSIFLVAAKKKVNHVPTQDSPPLQENGGQVKAQWNKDLITLVEPSFAGRYRNEPLHVRLVCVSTTNHCVSQTRPDALFS